MRRLGMPIPTVGPLWRWVCPFICYLWVCVSPVIYESLITCYFWVCVSPVISESALSPVISESVYHLFFLSLPFHLLFLSLLFHLLSLSVFLTQWADEIGIKPWLLMLHVLCVSYSTFTRDCFCFLEPWLYEGEFLHQDWDNALSRQGNSGKCTYSMADWL